MGQQPLLTYLSPAGKFWMLMLLFLLSLMIFSLIAALVLIPFSGISSLSDIGKITDYTNPNVIIGMKVAQTISAIGTFILPAFLFSKLIADDATAFLKINTPPKISSLFAVVLLMVAMLPLINWMAAWNSRMIFPEFLSGLEQWMKNAEADAKQLTEAFLRMETITDLFVNLFIVAFLAALSEELMFRGVIQRLLTDWVKNKHLAIWITAIIFSAFHFQFYGFIPRMALGALLGYLFMWSESLWLPIFAHFMNNAMAVVVQYLIVKGSVSADIETFGENNEFAFLLPGILITGVLLFYLHKAYAEQKSSLH